MNINKIFQNYIMHACQLEVVVEIFITIMVDYNRTLQEFLEVKLNTTQVG